MDEETRQRFAEALERKQREAAERATQGEHPHRPDAAALEPQDVNREDPRAKNSGHGKKTADKWNQ